MKTLKKLKRDSDSPYDAADKIELQENLIEQYRGLINSILYEVEFYCPTIQELEKKLKRQK